MDDTAASREELIDDLTRLGQETSLATARFHQVAAASYGMGINDMRAIGVLMQSGPLTAGQLAHALELTSGAVTGLVDRLIRHGAATRDVHPTDRRSVTIAISSEWLRTSRNEYLPMGKAFAELHATYTEEQLRFLVDYHRATLAITNEQVRRIMGAIT